MTVQFKVFRATFSSWNTLFRQAAEFASQFEPQRLISISQSEGQGDGVVTVWFWGSPGEGHE